MNSYYENEDKKVLSLITLKNAKILDVGCGEGRYIIPLSKNHQCVGIDINPTLVKRLTEMGLHVYTPENLDYPDKYFDYIIMSHIEPIQST